MYTVSCSFCYLFVEEVIFCHSGNEKAIYEINFEMKKKDLKSSKFVFTV